MSNSYNPKQAAQKQSQATQTQPQQPPQIVLQAFDEAMADSDSEIIAGLEARLGGDSDGFFGFDLEAEFAALLTKPEPVQTDAPPAGEQTIDAPALAVVA
jgi:hypothetical protein